MDESASPVTLSPNLAELSDSDLLAGTCRLVGASNQLLAALLTHLGEVEARGIHRTRACASLYTYCIYELRLSEDAAYRRVTASRLVRRFPCLFDAIASGELHLTALLMLGPHLTPENLAGVLPRAKHRTKKEIAQLVRELDPVPDVPARIEPLGPAPVGFAATPRFSWQKFMLSLNPVRNLTPGERPRDWMAPELSLLATDEVAAGDLVSPEPIEPALARTEPALAGSEVAPARSEPAPARTGAATELSGGDAIPAPTGPHRYSVQFTATAEHVELVKRAQALLSNLPEGASLAAIHLQAMRELVAALEKRKYAVNSRSRKPTSAPAADNGPRQRGRYVPAAVRREVFERDAARCAYVDSSGQRCRETSCLELHHLEAFALGGEHSAPNLALRCRAHNALAAEEDFGRELIEQKRQLARHESFASVGADAKSDTG